MKDISKFKNQSEYFLLMVAFFLSFRVQFSQRSTWRFFLCQVNVIFCFEFSVNNICYHQSYAIPLSLLSVSGGRRQNGSIAFLSLCKRAPSGTEKVSD